VFASDLHSPDIHHHRLAARSHSHRFPPVGNFNFTIPPFGTLGVDLVGHALACRLFSTEACHERNPALLLLSFAALGGIALSVSLGDAVVNGPYDEIAQGKPRGDLPH
jgi:hypothetical protein